MWCMTSQHHREIQARNSSHRIKHVESESSSLLGSETNIRINLEKD